jgi:hypothetical protein
MIVPRKSVSSTGPHYLRTVLSRSPSALRSFTYFMKARGHIFLRSVSLIDSVTNRVVGFGRETITQHLRRDRTVARPCRKSFRQGA